MDSHVTVTERAPLSFNQQFLCLFDRGDGEGPFGPKYNIVCGWRLTGPVAVGPLHDALADVVERHEALRSRIVREGEGGHQEIFPPSRPALVVRDLSGTEPERRDLAAEELLVEVESGAYGMEETPLLRAFLGLFDTDDAILVLVAHHTAADEWSMRVIMRDLAVRYAIRVGELVPDLPPVRQYQEFARWQQSSDADGASQRYWREKLDGARIFATPTDHPRSAGLPKETAWYRFSVEKEVTDRLAEVARATKSSPFMVLLAAYSVLLHRSGGPTDIVVPTFTSGRLHGGFHDTVGSFFNFVPLRLDLSGCESFRQVVTRVRSTCLEAYRRDIPFTKILQEAPELMSPAAADDRAVLAFQVFRSPLESDRHTVGRLEYAEIRDRRLPQASGGDVPDGAMWHLELLPAGGINGTLAYNTNLFLESTVSGMAEDFRQVLRSTVAAPDAPLARL
ncbi:condensation domain-containing protein [Planomonospora corallina]|uniref:Condensation domain-containing protein n=1 Tax=Planomonospora corallina TaxID=1806052 RepID=A0ABV8I2D4_9ACTN